MSEPLLSYYNRELAFIRKMGAEFAAANPKIAGRLRIGAESIEDPHVSRLIEAFAYLNARTRHKIDDDFPEVCEALLGTLYPHYLAPLPSMAIVQLELAAAQASLVAGYEIAAGAEVESEPIDGEPCRFVTAYPVTLWPIRLVEASLRSQPFTAPMTPVSGEAVAMLRLCFECVSPEVTFADLELQSLRLFLRGQQQYVHDLYQVLHNRVLGVAVASSPTDSDPSVLSRDQVRQVGFEPDEQLLNYTDRCLPAYALLTEFFAYPDKFMFADVQGLDGAARAGLGRRMELYFYLSQYNGDLERNVGVDSFHLGCTPMVNLFRRRAEPVRLTQTGYEYRVVPDSRRPESLEVYSVDQVTATSPSDETEEFLPFYSVRHSGSSHETRRFYHTSRRSAGYRGGRLDDGTEVYLSMVDLDFDLASPADWVVDVETTCLNRDLPQRLPYGGGQPRLQLVGGVPVGAVRCLTPPTPTRRPQLRDGARWRLISHLTLNHLSLAGEGGGADALREMLSLYNFDDSPDVHAMIEGIVHVGSRPATGRVQQGATRGVCRGLEISVTFDPEKFGGSGVFLLASVLERFFSRYTTINSFTRFVAKLHRREGVLRQWPPRAGDRILH